MSNSGLNDSPIYIRNYQGTVLTCTRTLHPKNNSERAQGPLSFCVINYSKGEVLGANCDSYMGQNHFIAMNHPEYQSNRRTQLHELEIMELFRIP